MMKDEETYRICFDDELKLDTQGGAKICETV